MTVETQDRRKHASCAPDAILRITVPVRNLSGLPIEVVETLANVFQLGSAALFRNRRIVRFRNAVPRAKLVLFAMSFDNVNPPTHCHSNMIVVSDSTNRLPFSRAGSDDG